MSKAEKQENEVIVANTDKQVYHMNNINNFHSKLKQCMIRFNGVATKYLDNYINYFREVRDNIDIFSQLLNIQGFYRVVDIRNRKICFEKWV